MSANPMEQVPPRLEMALATVERRRRTRMRVRWPLRFVEWGTAGIVETVTRDLSSEGFYFVADTSFIAGEFRICTLALPSNDSWNGDRKVLVECKVRIVRVEAKDDGLYGVGCHIEDYRILNSSDG